MNKVLLLFAHPLLEKSRIHKALIKESKNLEGVTFHDLYEAYPEYLVDVEREKDLLLHHDIIIWQHPFYWYSCPPLLKQWIDMVLEVGWAYGPGGNQLENKKLLQCISTGGSESAYTAAGSHGHTIHEFLLPFSTTTKLCKITYLPPFIIHATHLISDEELGQKVEEYKAMLKVLVSTEIDFSHLNNFKNFNQFLNGAKHGF